MAKRKLAAGYESDSDSNLAGRPRKKHSKLTPPLYTALVDVEAGSRSQRTNSSRNEVIIARIKKCLARGNDRNAIPEDAKRALYKANQLKRQHDISEAELIENESPDKLIEHAGTSIVTIKRTDGDLSKPVQQHCYVDRLARAMTDFFICKHYSTRMKSRKICTSINFHFYGVAGSTITAAHGFMMVYNLLSKWSRAYKGTSAQNSYCLGAGEQLLSMGKAAKKAERAQATREEAKRHEEEDAVQSAWENYETYDGFFVPDLEDTHEAAFNCSGDADDDTRDVINPERRNASSLVVWKSESQLDKYTRDALKAADEYLKDQGVELCTARKRCTAIRDTWAYGRGVEEGRTIDVYRKRLGH